MVCENIIRNMERKLGRKLTKEERRKIEEEMHHVEVDEDGEYEEAIAV